MTMATPNPDTYIVKLNHDQTKIIAVYLNKRMAVQFNMCVIPDTITQPVKYDRHYYMLYRDLSILRSSQSERSKTDKNHIATQEQYGFCDEQLKQEFITEKLGGNSPIFYENGIAQLDHDCDIIQTFKDAAHCCEVLGITPETLAECITNYTLHPESGCYYQQMKGFDVIP